MPHKPKPTPRQVAAEALFKRFEALPIPDEGTLTINDGDYEIEVSTVELIPEGRHLPPRRRINYWLRKGKRSIADLYRVEQSGFVERYFRKCTPLAWEYAND